MRTNITYLPSILGRLLLIVFLALLEGCDIINPNSIPVIQEYSVVDLDQKEDMEIEVENSSMEDFMWKEEDLSAVLSQPSSGPSSNLIIPFSVMTEEGNLNEQPMVLTYPTSPSTKLNRGSLLNNKRKERSDAEDKQEKEKEAEREKKKLRKKKGKEEESTVGPSPFEQLPDELITEIFSYVEISDIVNCLRLNNYFYNLIYSNAANIRGNNNFKAKTINFHNILPWDNLREYNIERDLVFKYFTSKVKKLPSLLWPSLARTQVEEFDWSNTPSESYEQEEKVLKLAKLEVKFLAESLKHCLPHVKRLNLAGSFWMEDDITPLLSVLPTLSKLEILDLSYNPLGNQAMLYLFNALKDLNLKKLSLVKVDLSEAQYEDAPRIQAGQLPILSHLEELNLYNNINAKDDIVAILAACPNLKRINLQNTGLSGNQADALADALAKLSHLGELNLSSNQQLKDKVVKIIATCPNLKRINLGSTGLSENQADALADALAKLSHLEELDLSSNEQLENKVVKIIAACPNLKRINLESTGLSGNVVQDLLNALDISKLERLNLSYNKLHTNGGIVALCEGLQEIPNLNLKQLTLSGIDFDSQAIRALIKMLPHLSKLEKIDYWSEYGFIGPIEDKETAQLLGKNLHKLPNLKILYLTGGSLSNELIISMVESFLDHADKDLSESPNLKLEKLNISDLKFGLEGAKALAKILPYFPCLKNLDFGGNRLNDEGITILVDALKLPNLKKLHMYGNQLGLEGAEALAKILPHLSKLKKLNLESCNLTEEVVSKISNSLGGRKIRITWAALYLSEEEQGRFKQNFPNVEWYF